MSLLALCVSPVAAASNHSSARLARADAPRAGNAPPGVSRSPSAPPLLDTQGAATSEDPEASGPSSPAAVSDPLVSNGLGSPSCRSGLADELARAAHRNCELSDFVGAAAPTGDYGIDVHIDTGTFGLSSGGLLSAVQDLGVTPVWMAVVWIVHALIVMLEWCFALDLLNGGIGLASVLGSAQRYLTGPWLPLMLSIAAVLLAYDGLVRRRVAESVGQALLALAMIAGGLWVMLNPVGTVGALSSWSNEAGLGTLAVAARGTPVAPGGALGAAMEDMFSATVEGPWCYLEFGNVQWCRNPARLDRGLEQAGLKLAAEEASQAQPGGPASQAVAHSVRLLREARTNGAIFLALPSNGPGRNSINSEGSLLRALCRSPDATDCTGPSAAEAEFRTNSGTWSRAAGLVLIVLAVLGILLLFGHIGMRLLMAAMLSFFYLLLAPGIVLAPALGERGRALFRAWAMRLFGAIASKLVFAFLLGVLLAMLAVLQSLNGLGWWTQWLLTAAFCWGLFFKRHQVLGALSAGSRQQPVRATRRRLGRFAGNGLEDSFRRRWNERFFSEREEKRRQKQTGSGGRSPDKPAKRGPGRDAPRAERDGQVLAMLRGSEGDAADGASGGMDKREAQLARISTARAEALATGDSGRALRLESRQGRIAAELDAERTRSGLPSSPGDHARFLAEQAALPRSGARDASGRRRDYPALAPLAWLTRAAYTQLEPGRQRAARLEIDRELAARREARETPRGSGGRTDPAPILPAERSRSNGEGSTAQVPVAIPRRSDTESDAVRDMRAVAEGRKRQLGLGRP